MQASITGNRLGLMVPGRGTLLILELTDRYAIAAPSTASPGWERVIFCATCKLVSNNPNDVEQRYCGHCRVFHREAVRS